VIIVVLVKKITTVAVIYQVNPIATMIFNLIINYLNLHLAMSLKQLLFYHLSLLLVSLVDY